MHACCSRQRLPEAFRHASLEPRVLPVRQATTEAEVQNMSPGKLVAQPDALATAFPQIPNDLEFAVELCTSTTLKMSCKHVIKFLITFGRHFSVGPSSMPTPQNRRGVFSFADYDAVVWQIKISRELNHVNLQLVPKLGNRSPQASSARQWRHAGS